jgi:hypothetical protein
MPKVAEKWLRAGFAFEAHPPFRQSLMMKKEIHRPAIDVSCRTGVVTWFDVCFKSFPESVLNLSPMFCCHYFVTSLV